MVAATDITRDRYRQLSDAPYEDSGITFFLDDRRPSSVDVAFYTPAPATYHWYWNLDLYAYDRPRDRPGHAVGTYTAAEAGWHTAHLVIPPGMTRAGLNKLGFRAEALRPVVLCPKAMSDESCIAEHARRVVTEPADASPLEVAVVRPTGLAELAVASVALFASAVELHYDRATSAPAAPGPAAPPSAAPQAPSAP